MGGGEGPPGDWAGRLLPHQRLVADYRLGSDRTAHVMDGPPPRDRLAGLALVLQDVSRYCANMHMKQKRDVGEAEDRFLCMGLATETNDLIAAGVSPPCLGAGLLGVFCRGTIEGNRQKIR